MPHGYALDYEKSDICKYSKTHKNGEETVVLVEQTGTKAAGGTSWLVNVKDPNGNKRIGKWPTKEKAKQKARQWMNRHPKGVRDTAGGAIPGAGSGLPGVNGGNLF